MCFCRNGTIEHVRFSDDSFLQVIPRSGFLGVSSLRSIVLPKSVETIESGAFSGCGSLEKIIAEGVKTVGGVYAFLGCLCLEVINCPKAVKVDNLAFAGCPCLSKWHF